MPLDGLGSMGSMELNVVEGLGSQEYVWGLGSQEDVWGLG